MVRNLFLSSFFLLTLPMTGIPFLPLKIPPLYQIILLFISIIIILSILSNGIIKKNLLYIISFLILFDIYLILINSSILQIISISSYILILALIKNNLFNLVLSNEKRIDQVLFIVYYIIIGTALLQVVAYYLFGSIYLIDYNYYLTSGLYSYTLNSPISGWNQSFRPNAFFAEPSFLGFFIVVFALYKFQKDYKFGFLIFNILLLHLFGIRSGEIVLILVTIYIVLEKYFGRKTSLNVTMISISMLFFSVFLFNDYLISKIDIHSMDYSTYQRTTMLLQGIEVFKNNIITGVGLGNLSEIFVSMQLYDRNISNIGNLLIQILAEIGIVGFILLIIILSRIYTFSYSFLGLFLSMFFVGGYSLLYMWIIPLLATIYIRGKDESSISKQI